MMTPPLTDRPRSERSALQLHAPPEHLVDGKRVFSSHGLQMAESNMAKEAEAAIVGTIRLRSR